MRVKKKKKRVRESMFRMSERDIIDREHESEKEILPLCGRSSPTVRWIRRLIITFTKKVSEKKRKKINFNRITKIENYSIRRQK